MSVLTRKSWGDIRKRKSRSFFTILTIAAAVASLSLFAIAPLTDRAMQDRLREDRLHDIRFYLRDTVLTAADTSAIAGIPGVTAVETRSVHFTRFQIDERRAAVILVGIQDFDHQEVNVVRMESGAPPGPGEVAVDPQDTKTGRLRAETGTTLQIETADGSFVSLAVSGVASTLEFTTDALEDDPVLYLPQETLRQIAGLEGINSLELRVAEGAQRDQVVAAVRAWFATNHPESAFSDLPDVREEGTWPGEEIFNNFVVLFYVGAVLALISSAALVSNTMTTMVAEQRREIAIMKAIGGRRGQVARSFLTTVLLLAVAGTVVGALVGIPFGNFITGIGSREFLGVNPDWGVAWWVVAMSIVVGIVGTTLAALPALLRASRGTVQEGLRPQLSSVKDSWLERVLRRVPMPRHAQIGLRNITRRKVRTLGTAIQVGLATGVAIGFLALGVTITGITEQTWDTFSWDVIAYQRSAVPLDHEAGAILTSLDGVEVAHPLLYNDVGYDDTRFEVWGIPAESTMYEPTIIAGTWLEPPEESPVERQVVIGRALAKRAGVGVGDAIVFDTAMGPIEFVVVGIEGSLANNATGVFIPLETLQAVLGRTDTNAYWLKSFDESEAAIDNLALRAEDALEAAGYPAGSESRYVERAANVSSNASLVRVLAVMGIPIVAIGLIGLVNMMTVNILERTREIGILRCIGARSRDISRVFRAEGLAVAALGWVLAVPLGWLIGRAIVEIIVELFGFGSIGYSFPLLYPLLALVATLALTWLVVIVPLRRATSLRPGDALRYE